MAEEIPSLAPPRIAPGTSDASAVLRHDTQARFWLALAVLAQFVLLIGFIVYRGTELPDSQLILGGELSLVTIVISYFFGSSAGSVGKSASKSPTDTEVR